VVRLSQIASISSVTTAAQINRRDRHRQVTVAANLADGVVQSKVAPAVQQAVDQLVLPPGYTTSQGGAAQQQAQSFGQLGAALGISIMLAYLLMAVLYNSLIHPFVILFGLPLAFGGAIIATFLFHYTINVFSMIGMILLVGLAIKNGILLVDRTNQNRARGMDVIAALTEAGPTRLRAILMTSLTIAASLTPTAFQLGEGADLRAPLAATVMGGVISSTALTLVVVPVMYTLLDGLHRKIGRAFMGLFRLVMRPFRAILRLGRHRETGQGSLQPGRTEREPGRGSLRPPAPVRRSARTSLRALFRGDPPLKNGHTGTPPAPPESTPDNGHPGTPEDARFPIGHRDRD
jgi:predicted RND superfamily exporter protein